MVVGPICPKGPRIVASDMVEGIGDTFHHVEHCVFTVLLPVLAERRAALEATLRQEPGHSPFGLATVETLHFASMTIHDDERTGPKLIVELNGEGRAETLLALLTARCRPMLHRVLVHCAGWEGSAIDDASAVAFLRARVQWPSARHVGNTGRSVARIRDEEALHQRLAATMDERQAQGTVFGSAADVRRVLSASADPHGSIRPPTGRLTHADWARRLLPPAAGVAVVPAVFVGLGIGVGWLFAVAIVVAVAVAVVVLIGAAAVVLRYKERRDPVATARPSGEQLHRVETFEDRGGVQNHLSSVVAVKGGPFRRTLLRIVLAAINLLARLVYTKGHLGKLTSIHFAHWSVIDGGRNLLFLSNFDGSWESYLDDFIEKAHSGLTAVWSNGAGFARTQWLIRDGATDGDAFKAWARISQLPSLVWYQAYPSLSIRRIDESSLLAERLHATLDPEQEQEWTRAL